MADPSASRLVPTGEGNRGFGGWKKPANEHPVWVSPKPTPEIEELVRWFPNAVQFPEEELSGEMASWTATAIVARSFGRRVALEALARELRWHAGLKGEVTAYGLDHRFYLVRFSKPEEKTLVLNQPWVVQSQVVAGQPWRPGFLPVDDAIHSALVWISIPCLPMEYWGEAALRRLLGAAGDFIFVDECTAARRRLEFARACARVDFRQLLRPGLLIMGSKGPFWQRFVYENLDGLYLRCGRMHSTDESCPFSKGVGMVESAGKEAPEDGSCGPRLGPWLLAVRRRQTGTDGVELGKKTTTERRPPGSSSQVLPGGDSWLKAHKVAPR